MRELVVRPPLAARIFVVLFTGGFVLCVTIVLVLAIARHQDVSGAPIGIGMALFAGLLGYRLAILSVRAHGPEIIIHDYWRTRRIPISQVEGLDIGRATAGSLRTVRILVRGTAIPVDALGVTRGILGRNASDAIDQLERRRQELADWLAQATISGRTGEASQHDDAGRDH